MPRLAQRCTEEHTNNEGSEPNVFSCVLHDKPLFCADARCFFRFQCRCGHILYPVLSAFSGISNGFLGQYYGSSSDFHDQIPAPSERSGTQALFGVSRARKRALHPRNHSFRSMFRYLRGQCMTGERHTPAAGMINTDAACERQCQDLRVVRLPIGVFSGSTPHHIHRHECDGERSASQVEARPGRRKDCAPIKII